MNEKLYLLENPHSGYFGNSPCWWKEGGSGYTPYVEEAKRWTKEEADREIATTSKSHGFIAWPLELVLKRCHTIIDTQDFAEDRPRFRMPRRRKITTA